MIKVSNFRVRDRLNIKSKAENITYQKQQFNHPDAQSSKHDEFRFSSLLQSFQNVITSLVNSQPKDPSEFTKNANPQNSHIKVDYRDRFINIEVPYFQKSKIDFKKLQFWVGEVCKQTLSIAFHYFLEKKLTYEQMKSFASENVLRNLVYLAESYKISPQHIKFIDQTIKQKIFPYLKTKYPLTVEKEINKSLVKAVKSIDNSQLPTNDYFFTSEIEFEFRQNGRYDDIIMRFLNEIMTKIDQKDEQNEITNYKKFKKLMKSIFAKSFDQNWMETGQTASTQISQKSQKEKEKFEQMIKSYTSYSIGRKISENTQTYSEQQIKSQSLSIKSPAILRILTKWCEQLWNKFEDQNFFMKRNDGFAMFSTKKIGMLTPYTKQVLSKHAQKQKQKIQRFLKTVEKINYEQQIQMLENQLSNDDENYIERYQLITGKFACKIINSIESFIIDYLNLLIHSLINVSNNCFNEWQHQYVDWWPFRFNLISFHVSDLMRCKYASREKEVIKIYNEIQKISNQNPDLIKIIRIKNRLKNATNDIMINAKFNNTINCEIQIAVNATHTDFTNCSNKINHYIYEMERAKFGPILEMCSIWKTYEKRSEAFERLIEKQKPKKKHVKSHEQCERNSQKNNFIEIKCPFVCSQCSKHYYNSNYIVSHLKCMNCDYWKCAVCTIRQNFNAENRQFFFRGNQHKSSYKFWTQKDKLPDNGACILINKPTIEVMIFKKYQDKFKSLLIHRKDNHQAILREIVSKKDYQKLYKDCLIFQLDQSIVNQQLRYQIDGFEQNIRSSLIIPSFIQQCLKQQKQTISIMNEPILAKVNMNEVVSKYRHQCKNIKNIEFYRSQLSNIDNLLPDFINLTRLNISVNRITDILPVFEFTKLEKLQINSNQISELPVDIVKLQKLEEFNAYGNKIQKIPEYFNKMSSLKVLNLNENLLIDIPENMDQLTNLKELNLSQNKLSVFPQCLGRLNKLQLLMLNMNQLKQIAQELQGFPSLKSLNLSENFLSKLPSSMNQMTKLTVFNLERNLIEQIPSSIKSLLSLQTLNMARNKLKLIPQQIGDLSKLTSLDFLRNQLTSVNPCVFRLKNLVELKISHNKIQEIEDCFDKLPKLKVLRIENNQLKIMPTTINLCPLTVFQFKNNPFEQFQLFSLLQKPANGIISIQNYKYLKRITCSELIQQKSIAKKIQIEHNILQEYPTFLNLCQNIEEINLYSNKIRQIPDSFMEYNKLTLFSMESNLLSELPLSFSYLKLLKVLVLNLNNFKLFPEQILSLQNLQKLCLQKNKIKEIPQRISNLQNLVQIYISENVIQSLPSGLGDISKLQKIDAGQNKIKQIPIQICMNKSIKILAIQNNQIQRVPKQINQMIGLLDNKSNIEQNPIKEVGDQAFMQNKFWNWKRVKQEIYKRNNNNLIENDSSNIKKD